MPARRSSRALLAAAAAGIAVTVLVVPTGAHAAQPAPSIRLVTGITHFTVDRFGHRAQLFLPEAVYVAATHGAFQIDATNRAGHMQLAQVRHTGSGDHTLRTITPAAHVDMSSGIPDFLTMTLRAADGQVITTSRSGFCPGDYYDAQRIAPSGPPSPTYPGYCGDNLTKATVWGIDRGWAIPVFPELKASPSAAPDGSYRLQVSIAPTYAHQLQVPVADRSRTLTMRLVTDSSGGCGDGFCPAARAAARSATPSHAVRLLTRAVPRPSYGPSRATGGGSGLPDLAALPAHSLHLRHVRSGDRDYLGFGATIWNEGPGTFDVEGFRIGAHPKMVARQYVDRAGHHPRAVKIGHFEFDTRPGHDHWHLEDVARYDLLDATGHRVVLSHKQSFCLAPTDPINLTRRNALWNPDTVGLTSSCPTEQSLWLRETLPVGWGDTYVQEAGGQAFNVTALPNGRYLIRVTTNPFGRIHETTRSNNTSLLAIQLGGTRGARTVTRIGPVTHG